MSLLDPARVIRFIEPCSDRFVHAPVLRWGPVVAATRFTVAVADVDQVVWTADVREPAVDLATAWPCLKLGSVDVLVRGFDDEGVEVSVRAHRRFWRVPGFDGLTPPPADWGRAAREAVAYLLDPARDDETEETDQPRNVRRSVEDSVTGLRGKVGYPALHHPSHILALSAFADRYPADPLAGQARRQAHAYGRWLLDHPLPAGWRCAGLTPETVGEAESGTLTLSHAARVGEALLRLHAHTGDDAYLRRAHRIADVLLDLREPDGSFPRRVDPRDGSVVERGTAVTPLRLLALLEAEPYGAARVRAEASLPTETDTLETIQYLLDPACELPDRVERAERLNGLVEDRFVMWAPEPPPVTVRCPTPVVLAGHHPAQARTGTWLTALLALHQATGADHYLAKGTAVANAIVAGQHEFGASSTWGLDTRFGTPLNTLDQPGGTAVAVSALLRWAAHHPAG